ncbi:MAG TPA: flagellar export chaperone FlgN [Chthoniobacteraceae bacterium]|nr:flagellar export chaperone FlgN [Chthoniobacteraceae bacterium]
MLALLEDQQNAIVARAAEKVLEINTAINDQMRMIQLRREARERFVAELSSKLEQGPASTLRELMRFFRKPIQPLIEALIDEINKLVTRARRRAQQNQMLLARSIEVMLEVLHRLNPESMHKVYGTDGRSLFSVRDEGSRSVAHT